MADTNVEKVQAVLSRIKETNSSNEKIEILSFKRSEQNLSNMRLLGEYILNNNPIKPKKS